MAYKKEMRKFNLCWSQAQVYWIFHKKQLIVNLKWQQ